MQIQLIRNATLKIYLNDRLILVDPMLGPKGCIESFGGIERNPTVELPYTTEEILEGVDFVLLTHLHADHWDEEAVALVDKGMPIFCQPGDQGRIEDQGFTRVSPIEEHTSFEGINIYRTEAQHGSGKILEHMGKASGYVLDSSDEPTVYIVGDSILTENVRTNVDRFQPEIVIANLGGAIIPGFESENIIMDAADAALLAEYIFPYLLIGVHLEALDHCKVSREEIELIGEIGDDKNIFVPYDGDIMDFEL
ncbi:MBL fold metallo-hydrolase [Flavobacteriaceae bacterium]|nr:MBL fold metallo-hydrolase [Flavobacteriaceae bacterium]